MSDSLPALIRVFVLSAPEEIVERVALACENSTNWDVLLGTVKLSLHSWQLVSQLQQIVQRARLSNYAPRELALALRSAKDVAEFDKLHQQLELVWTGPEVAPFSLRRTDEALLQMITTAQHSLLIVSFAVYRVERIIYALKQAVARNVDVQIFLETDLQKISTGGDAFIQALPPDIRFYSWSDESRIRNQYGNYGTLHAKFAVVDEHILLVSSANFTENAMSLNMELGLMVTGGFLPARAGDLLRELVSQGIFKVWRS